MIDERDLSLLHETLKLGARAGRRTRPNPLVGAIVSKQGLIVAQGFHHHVGAAHAEVAALDLIRGRARGLTLYVNLEPCSHHGRTPPCVERILEEGLARVVCCTRDPNPKVSGHGLEILRANGVEVECGALVGEALELNRVFFKNVLTGLPWVIMKAGMSLDGKIATATGHSQWITSDSARRASHRLRAQVDAVLVGITTVLTDDPLLNVRPPVRGTQNPAVIIADTKLRTPAAAALFSIPNRRVLIFAGPQASVIRERKLVTAGAEVIRVDADREGLNLVQVLQQSLASGLQVVLAEGGGTIHGALMSCGVVDELQLFVAPLLIGGKTAASVIAGPGVDLLESAPRLKRVRVARVGPDLKISGRFEQDWWRTFAAANSSRGVT